MTPAGYDSGDAGVPDRVQKYADRSWVIDYSEQERSFYIQVTEYHAEPLKLTFDQVVKMAGVKWPLKQKTENKVSAAEQPKPDAPVMTINKREKNLVIAVPRGWQGLLKISRKELYQYGKKMSRRSKIKSG